MLPEGVSALGPFLDTNFVGSMSLLTGTLPAQYGLRTAGVLDITSRSFATPGGEISLYGGSQQTFTPSFDYGGSVGDSEYFVTARGNWNALGLENPTPALNAIHDETQQGKFFGYASTLLDKSTRFSFISAASYSAFQIPNNPGQTPLGDFGRPMPIRRRSTKANTTPTSPISRPGSDTAAMATRNSPCIRVTPKSTSSPMSPATSNSTTSRRT